LATYRWAHFHTYNEQIGWLSGNDPSLFGGVPPSTWTDNYGVASQMSSDKEVLRTLLVNKGYAKANAMIMSETFLQFSSTNGLVGIVLFRVRNNLSSNVAWNPVWRFSAYSNWGERASCALNGVSVFQADNSGQAAINLLIPSSRVSTVICVSTSSMPFYQGSFFVRSTHLAFVSNSLILPDGLEFVDDLDTATGGWEQ